MSTLKITTILMFTLGLMVAGCEDDKKSISNPPSTSNNTTNNPNPANNDNEDHTHGSDGDDAKNSAKSGVMQGNWRVGKLDADNTPVMKFSLIHDEGAPEADGDYILFSGFDEYYHGTTGTDIKAKMQGEFMVATFNPTPDAEQLFTVKVSKKLADGQYEGTFSSVDMAVNFPVSIVLQDLDSPNDQ